MVLAIFFYHGIYSLLHLSYNKSICMIHRSMQCSWSIHNYNLFASLLFVVKFIAAT